MRSSSRVKRKASETPNMAPSKVASTGPSKKNSRSNTPAVVTPQPITKTGPKRRYVNTVTIDRETFKVGDHVYVILDEKKIGHDFDDQDECYNCGVCGSKCTKKSPLLECGRCLGGYHLHCLDPPLTEIPKGNWVCPDCSAGRPRRRKASNCMRNAFLQQTGLGLARIESIWEDTTLKEYSFSGRWYYVPEETHIGRQCHHVAREVFLSQLHDECYIESVIGRTNVINMADYYDNGEIDDDTFVCDYEYDAVWQRFRRHTRWDALDDGHGDDDWDVGMESGLSSDDDDEFDATCHVEQPRRNAMQQKGKRRRQGGQEFIQNFGTRVIPEHVRGNGSSTLARLCSTLALTASPGSLPCRETEYQRITSFVEEVLLDDDSGRGKCLYVSGIPGTGKTATVLQVMRALREKSEAKTLPNFQFVDINGLRLPSPQHAYSALYEALIGETHAPPTAAAGLEELFSDKTKAKKRPNRQHTIVLLDEMDLLVTKSQNVLYNMFDWPSRPGSYLSIIGVANTMDLPERLLPRIASRLAGNRLVFQPYQRAQLETIMKSRLGEFSNFDGPVINFIARKVANCSGDVRRCLELCRRSAEVAAKRLSKEGLGEDLKITMKDVDNAIRETFNTPQTQVLRGSSYYEKVLLAAMHLEVRFSGKDEMTLDKVAERMKEMCLGEYPDLTTIVMFAQTLSSQRLILWQGASRLKSKVTLCVPTADLLHVLTDEEELTHLRDRLK